MDERAENRPHIADRCPSCGHAHLFIGSGGWLTCSWLKCKVPGVSRAIAGLEARLAASEGAALLKQNRFHDMEVISGNALHFAAHDGCCIRCGNGHGCDGSLPATRQNLADALDAMEAERDAARAGVGRHCAALVELDVVRAELEEKRVVNRFTMDKMEQTHADALAARGECERLREALTAIVEHWDGYDDTEECSGSLEEDPEGCRLLVQAREALARPR